MFSSVTGHRDSKAHSGEYHVVQVENGRTRLACSCEVQTNRDFLGRVVGTIITRGAECAREEHEPGRVLIMPGRENARPQDR